MLKLSPNQVIKISTDIKLKKRIYLNLKNIFDDHRKQTVITIDENVIKRVIDLKKHITRRFRINQAFYLMNSNGYYLHPLESIDILRDEDIICVNVKSSLNNSRTEINNSEETAQTKKRKAVSDLVEQNSKCIRMTPLSNQRVVIESMNTTVLNQNDRTITRDVEVLSDKPQLELHDQNRPQILGLNDIIDFSLVRSRKKCLSEQFEKNSKNIETNKTIQEIPMNDSNKNNGKGIIILKNDLISPAKPLNIKKQYEENPRDHRNRSYNYIRNRRNREYVDDSRFEDAVNDKNQEHVDKSLFEEPIIINDNETFKSKCEDVSNTTKILECTDKSKFIVEDKKQDQEIVNNSKCESTLNSYFFDNKNRSDVSKTMDMSWTENDTISNTKDLELSKTIMANWTDMDESLNKSVEKRKRKRVSYNSHVLSGVGCVLDQLRNEASEGVSTKKSTKNKGLSEKNKELLENTTGTERDVLNENVVLKNMIENNEVEVLQSTIESNESQILKKAAKDKELKNLSKIKEKDTLPDANKNKGDEVLKNITKNKDSESLGNTSKNKDSEPLENTNKNKDSETLKNRKKNKEMEMLKTSNESEETDTLKNAIKLNKSKNTEYDKSSLENTRYETLLKNILEVNDSTKDSLIISPNSMKSEGSSGFKGFGDKLNTNNSPEIFDCPDFVTKRKRRRHRKSKKSVEDLDDSSTTITNTSIEFQPPKTKATPKIHKRFTDDEESYENDTSQNDESCKSDRIDKNCENDKSTSMDVSKNEKSLNITPDVTDYSQFLHSTPYHKMSVIPEESFVHPLNKLIENSKMLTSKPKIYNKILFKKLKLDENYTPIVSDFIYGKVLKITDDGDVQIKVLKGQHELKDPEGKFSLQEDDFETNTSILDTKWNLLLDTRLINDKH